MRLDRSAVFFLAAALATLAVSIPATYSMLAPFHDSGGYTGVALAVAAVAVFELGAVGAKLITLAIPRWSGRLTLFMLLLLALTTAANYIHGADLFNRATLAPGLAAIRSSSGAWLLVVGASALFPALLGVWLFAAVAHIRHLSGAAAATVAQDTQTAQELAAALAERDAAMAQVIELAAALEQSRATVVALPDPAVAQIGSHRYTTYQIAELFDKPESTVRRKLATLAAGKVNGHG